MTTKNGDFHHPNNLNNDFTKNYEKALTYVKDGLPVKETCMTVFNITERTFRNWEKWALSDIEAGFTSEDSNLIKLMLSLYKKDIELHRKLSAKAFEIAINNGNASMIQFLLKTRYNYTDKINHNLEFNNNENEPITINIVDMKEVNEI